MPDSGHRGCSRTFEAFGVPFEIFSEGRERLDLLCQHIPFQANQVDLAHKCKLRFELRESQFQYRVYLNGTPRSGPRDSIEQLLPVFAKRLELATALRSPHFTAIHAGVVRWQGLGWLFPGSSFSGKSTLVNELLKRGACYLGDEFALVDNSGCIHPYPRPLKLRTTEAPRPAPIVQSPIRADVVVMTRFVPGSIFKPQLLSQSQICLSMMQHSISARRRPKQTMDSLAQLVSGASGFASDRGEVAATIHELEKIAQSSRTKSKVLGAH